MWLGGDWCLCSFVAVRRYLKQKYIFPENIKCKRYRVFLNQPNKYPPPKTTDLSIQQLEISLHINAEYLFRLFKTARPRLHISLWKIYLRMLGWVFRFDWTFGLIERFFDLKLMVENDGIDLKISFFLYLFSFKKKPKTKHPKRRICFKTMTIQRYLYIIASNLINIISAYNITTALFSNFPYF